MKWLRQGAAVLALVVAAVAGYEGFVSQPYQDVAGVWTNGYGNTLNVGPNTPRVSEPQARARLGEHVDEFAKQVDKALTRPATVGQTVAYLSLTYNIGGGAFSKSTIVKDHNAGRDMDACLRILRFDKARVGGVLQPVRGLAKRRYGEYNVCIADLPNVGYVPRGKP